MARPEAIKRLVGHEVTIHADNGELASGLLINVTRRTLWLLKGDEDCFVDLSAVQAVHPA
jgi:hypothetical protein